MERYHTKIETFKYIENYTQNMRRTIFTESFGNSPTIRLLDFLMEGRNLDYSLTDIAKNSNIGWTTLHRIWQNLEKLEMVKQTRIIGKAKLYKLNMNNKVIKKLVNIYDLLLYQQTEKHLAKKLAIKVKNLSRS